MPEQTPRIPLEVYERGILHMRCQTNPQIKEVLARIKAGKQVWRDEIPADLYQWVQDKFAELKASAESKKVPLSPQRQAAKAKMESAKATMAAKVNKQVTKG